METHQITAAIGAELTELSVPLNTANDVSRASGVSTQAPERYYWDFRSYEVLRSSNPPLWEPSTHGQELDATQNSAKSHWIPVVPVILWRDTLGVYTLRRRVDATHSIPIAVFTVTTDDPIAEVIMLNTQDAVVPLSISPGHHAFGSELEWTVFDMDSLYARRRGYVYLNDAVQALIDGLKNIVALRDPRQEYTLQLTDGVEQLSKAADWTAYPRGRVFWHNANNTVRQLITMLLSSRNQNPRTPSVEISLPLLGKSLIIDTTQPPIDDWQSVFGALQNVLGRSRNFHITLLRNVYVTAAISADHPAPDVTRLDTGSTSVQLNLTKWAHSSTVAGGVTAGIINLYVIVHRRSAEVSYKHTPVAVFELHALARQALPARKNTLWPDPTVLRPPTVLVSDSKYTPRYDSTDAGWSNVKTGTSAIQLFGMPLARDISLSDALVSFNQRSLVGSHTPLTLPLPPDSSMQGFFAETSEDDLALGALFTVEDREDPILAIMLGKITWPVDGGFDRPVTQAGAKVWTQKTFADGDTVRAQANVFEIGLRGRRVLAVEQLIAHDPKISPFPVVSPKIAVDMLQQTSLPADSIIREQTLKALDGVRALSGQLEYIPDALPPVEEVYQRDAYGRTPNPVQYKYNTESTKHPVTAGWGFPSEPSYHDATKAARALASLANMTYEDWIKSNPVMREAMRDPETPWLSPLVDPSTMELDTYISRLTRLVSDDFSARFNQNDRIRAAIVGARLRDSIQWLRQLESASGAITAPLWLQRPTLITIQPRTIEDRYTKQFPVRSLGAEHLADIREWHLPKVQADLLKMGLAQDVEAEMTPEIRKFARGDASGAQLPALVAAAIAAKTATTYRPIAPAAVTGALSAPAPLPMPAVGTMQPKQVVPLQGMVVQNPLHARILAHGPDLVRRLRTAGWSHGAQTALLEHAEAQGWTAQQWDVFTTGLTPISVQPSSAIDASIVAAVEKLLGVKPPTDTQLQQAFARRQQAQAALDQIKTQLVDDINRRAQQLNAEYQRRFASDTDSDAVEFQNVMRAVQQAVVAIKSSMTEFDAYVYADAIRQRLDAANTIYIKKIDADAQLQRANRQAFNLFTNISQDVDAKIEKLREFSDQLAVQRGASFVQDFNDRLNRINQEAERIAPLAIDTNASIADIKRAEQKTRDLMPILDQLERDMNAAVAAKAPGQVVVAPGTPGPSSTVDQLMSTAAQKVLSGSFAPAQAQKSGAPPPPPKSAPPKLVPLTTILQSQLPGRSTTVDVALSSAARQVLNLGAPPPLSAPSGIIPQQTGVPAISSSSFIPSSSSSTTVVNPPGQSAAVDSSISAAARTVLGLQ